MKGEGGRKEIRSERGKRRSEWKGRKIKWKRKEDYVEKEREMKR